MWIPLLEDFYHLYQDSYYVDPKRVQNFINIWTGSKFCVLPAGGGLVRSPCSQSSVSTSLGAKNLEFKISYLLGYSIATALLFTVSLLAVGVTQEDTYSSFEA